MSQADQAYTSLCTLITEAPTNPDAEILALGAQWQRTFADRVRTLAVCDALIAAILDAVPPPPEAERVNFHFRNRAQQEECDRWDRLQRRAELKAGRIPIGRTARKLEARMRQLESAILSLPAHTVEGLKVKARIVLSGEAESWGDADPEARAALSLARDLLAA